MTKTILLISPDSDNEGLWITGEESSQVRNNMLPIGLATITAMTPDEFSVDIWDELVHGRIDASTQFARTYDLVGITGFKTHLPRCREVAAEFRRRGITVAIGGPGVSGTPDAYRGDFDILFIGEAENTWPQFLRDWTAGETKTEYRQIEKPDLAESPKPDWRPILDDVKHYAMGCVQTTRGCPFDCEFCDVIYLFGRRSRHKPIETVLDEVREMQKMGMHSVFFCDDEFIGHPKYVKDLLRQLIPLNNSFEIPITYSTQLTMNLSKDEELLELLADANFNLVFVGIETPNVASLKETGKLQNVRQDLVGDVRKILSYGIAIRAGIICGFDNDDVSIFDVQYDFIQRTYLPSLAVNMLKAPLGTRLWSRLRQEGRVITLAKVKDKLGHARSYTNILPKSMSRVELMEGYKGLLQRIYSWDSFRERIEGFVSIVSRAPRVREPQLTPEETLEVCMTTGVPPEQRDLVKGLIDFTHERAPFMLRRVKIIIVQFAKFVDTIEALYPQLDHQLGLERRGEFPLEADDRPITLPPSFREAFGELFPPVYRRVYLNLDDKDQVPAALTEIFVDFLVRWGSTFEALEAHHHTFLSELCDRTCAQINGVPPQDFVPEHSEDLPVPSIRKNRLADDILKSVEQELFKFVASGESA